MSKKKLDQEGFAHIAIVLVLVVLVVVGFAGWRVVNRNKNSNDYKPTSEQVDNTDRSLDSKPLNTSPIAWSRTDSGWTSNGTVPACQNPLTIQSPVDIGKASAVLYPGQYRGGNYKSHGGFIFNGSSNDSITVKVPQDSAVYKGSRYIESGEVQYMFILIAPCGIMYRFDHLLTLSPAFQKLADSLPPAKVDDSTTTNFTTAPTVKANEIVATAVGFKKSGNTSVDFGVYDLRVKNAVSQTAAWQKEHPMANEFGAYGICWLNNLTGSDKTRANALPGGDGQAGKKSDYCK